MTETPPDRLLTVAEVAERLQCSRSYVYMLMKRRALGYVEMPAAKRSGTGLLGRRIRESVLEAFIDSQTVEATAQ
jgi:excisionase family DNA binding protein